MTPAILFAAGLLLGSALTVVALHRRRNRDEPVLHADDEPLAHYADRLEQAVRESTRELERTETRYRHLYDASPDLYLTLDGQGRVTDVNRTALDALGRTRDEVVGRPVTHILDDESRERLEAWAEDIAASEELENVECRLRGRGGPIDAILSSRMRRGDAGSPSEARVTLRDITRLKDLQRQLVQTEKLATTGRLAASVAHEVNNPLQALLMHLALVEEALPEDFSERESWIRVQEGVRRVHQVVHDLLDLHRGNDPGRQRVDINGLAKEALGLARTQLEVARIEVRARFEAGLPWVPGGPRRLYQVILNLILNAAEAMASGGVLGVATRSDADRVILEVSDTGPGIPPEQLSSLFDPFRTGGKKRGTGLGLFVTYSLVKEHDGEIEVESGVGEGTLMRVVLPRRAEAPPTDAPAPDPKGLPPQPA